MRRNATLVTILLAAPLVAVSCGGSAGPTALEPGPILGECLVEPNYVGHTPLNRWRDFPLRHHVAASTFPVEDRDRIVALIVAGLLQWAEGTDGRIGTLVATDDPLTADLIVEAQVLETAAAVSTHATGTPYLARGRIVFDRETVVRLAALQDGALLSALAAHEMGHILGIIGHPTTEVVLMSQPFGALRPTPADLHTISHAYCLSKG